MLLWFRLILILLTVGIAMQFNCTHPCKGTFSTRAGLNRHQNDCSFHQTSQALKQEQRRARLTLLSKANLKAATSKPAGKSLDIRKSRINLQAQVSALACTKLG
jgi:hypothetical protein